MEPIDVYRRLEILSQQPESPFEWFMIWPILQAHEAQMLDTMEFQATFRIKAESDLLITTEPVLQRDEKERTISVKVLFPQLLEWLENPAVEEVLNLRPRQPTR
jgi:hypothetical protein